MAYWAIGVLVGMAALGGFVQGLTGFGFAMMTSPVLLLYMDPVTVVFVNIAVSFSLGGIAFLSRHARSGIRGRELLILCAAMLPGQFVGVSLVAYIPANVLKLIVLSAIVPACIALLFRMTGRRPRAEPPAVSAARRTPRAAAAVGFLSGLLTPTTGINGPPVVLYLWNRYRDKSMIRSTSLAFFLVAMAIGMISMASALDLGPEIGAGVAWGMPAAWVGFGAGSILFKRVSHDKFKRYVLIVLAGASAAGIVGVLI